MFFHLLNLSGAVVYDTPQPWDATSKRPRLANKDEFREWIKASSTQHYFYSGFEGINQSARIGKENPPYRMHGLVADYDGKSTDAEIDALLAKNALREFRPTWISHTFSGGVRLIWEFEEPIFCYNAGLTKELLKRLKVELKCAKLLNGLDEGVFTKPDQYYELGTEWRRYSDVRISKKTLGLWIFQAGSKTKWSVEGTEIPIELIAAEVESQYPGKWQGDFAEGARGPRFWDPSGDNETAAIVRSSGMQCFTGDRPFVPWATILGHSFTRGFEADRIATATDGIYYDNRHYWQRDDKEAWYSGNLESLQLHLRVKAGLSRDPGNETSSEVDKAVYHIQRQNRVIAALPFVHRPKGLHREPDGLYLNTSNLSVCAPADGIQSWGEDFPWMASYFKGFFSSEEQLDFFLAWLQRFYKTAYERNLQPGHAVFIAGKVNQGKTLLGTKIIGPMLGGAADATSYLLGESSWNSFLFERAVWNVDDPKPGRDPRMHAVYSASIKKHVANQEFDFQQKFRDGGRVTWTGRPIITLNDDEVSLGMLPEMDISIMDKIDLFRAADRKFDFRGCEGHIRKELPFFCRWLLDWTAPEKTIGESRYGVKEYHEASMLEAAHEGGKYHEFKEIIDAFLIDWFRGDKSKAETAWKGPATRLFLDMMSVETLKEVVRKMTPALLGRNLRHLMAQGTAHLNSRNLHGRTIWTLDRAMIGDGADEKA